VTPSIRELMLVVSNSLAASVIAKVTIIAALGLLAAWLARDSRAAVRHALLAAMFGVMLLLPAASLLMPPLHIGVPTVIHNSTTFLPFGLRAEAEISATTGSVATRAAAVRPSVSRISLSNLLLLGWAVGVVAFILPVVVGLCQIRLLRRSGLPWRHGQSVVDSLALSAGIRRRIEVLLHEKTPGPMMCGVANPAIVLPRDAETWNSEDLNRAIVHELEHVRRGDSASRCLARAICAVYWFHPLVWIAWRKLVLEAERACDDAVLASSEATAYADQLVDLAKRMSAAQGSPLLAMASRADLATRVLAVLNGRQRRGRAGKFSLTLACAAAVMLVLWLSPVTLIASPQQVQQAFEVASLRRHITPPGQSLFRRVPDVLAVQIKGNRVTGQLLALTELVADAYDVRDFQIQGAPDWAKPGAGAEYYDLAAIAPDATTPSPAQVRLMLQTLLTDRFQLKFRHETKETSVYNLTIAKGGTKLMDAAGAVPPKVPAKIPPGTSYVRGNMSMLLRMISTRVDRPVMDKTGLAGIYVYPWSNPNPAEDTSIFTLLEDELGLKLEPARVQVDMLTIEHVERPSDN
jgi:uncharacterized protein (TIGR03435 family)